MILSKPVGTVYGHNLMWHRFWKFTVFKKKNTKTTKTKNTTKQKHQNNNKKAPICFEVISYLFHSVPSRSVAIEFDKQVLHLPYPTAFMIFVNHHICSLPTIFLQIEELQSLQSFLAGQLLFLLDNFLSFSVLFLTHVLLEMHRTAHSVSPSLEY